MKNIIQLQFRLYFYQLSGSDDHLRKDPISEKTYRKSIKLIEESLNLNIRQVPVFLISKKELEKLMPKKRKYLLIFIRGFYSSIKDTIFIVDGNEEDLQTFIHETLHSNSIFHLNNSPIWISEGLTIAISEKIMKSRGLQPVVNLYLEKEKKFWLNKLRTHKKQIIQAYFSKNINQGIKILEEVLERSLNSDRFRI